MSITTTVSTTTTTSAPIEISSFDLGFGPAEALPTTTTTTTTTTERPTDDNYDDDDDFDPVPNEFPGDMSFVDD